MSAIAPTVTHRVRAFLTSHGATLAPWSGLEQTYARLYALLSDRKNDPSFWPPLRELIGSILSAAAEPGRLAAPEAELLRSWDVDCLVEELRKALPECRSEARGWRDLLRLNSVSALGAFLMIGWVAAGCGGKAEQTVQPIPPGDASVDASVEASAEANPPEVGSDAWNAQCPLSPDSALYQALVESNLGDSQKASLCKCFSGLNANWNEGLSELFATGTPQQIASALNEMLACCQFDVAQLSQDFASVKDAFLNGTLCSYPKPYRGVTLPDP